MSRVSPCIACICCLAFFPFSSALSLAFSSNSDIYDAMDSGLLNSSDALTLVFSPSSFLLSRTIYIRAPTVIIQGPGAQITCSDASFSAMRFEATATSIFNLNVSSCLEAISTTPGLGGLGNSGSSLSVKVEGCSFNSNGAFPGARASSLSLQCNALPCFLTINSSSFTSNQGGRGVVVMDRAGPASAVSVSETTWSLNSHSSSLFVDGANGTVTVVLYRCTFDRQHGGSGVGQGSLSTVDITGVLAATMVGCSFNGCATGDAVAGLSLGASSSQLSHVSMTDTIFLSQSASLGRDPLACAARPPPNYCLPWASSAYIWGFSHVSIDSVTVHNNSGLSTLRLVNCPNVSISRSSMVGNSVSGLGGAIYLANRNFVQSIKQLRITSCSFDGNAAINGGGGVLFLANTPTNISNSTFTQNTANGPGGAIYSTDSSIYVRGSNFTRNEASGNGGGIDCVSVNSNPNDLLSISGFSFFIANSVTQANGSGGAVHVSLPRAEVWNATFFNNIASQGPGLSALGTSLIVDAASATLACTRQNSAGNATNKTITYCDDYTFFPRPPSPPPLPLSFPPSSPGSEPGGDRLGLILGLSIGLGLSAVAVIFTLLYFFLKTRQEKSTTSPGDPFDKIDNPSVPPSTPWDPVKELEQLAASLKLERLARAPSARWSNETSDPDHQSSSVSLQLGASLPDTLEIYELIGQGGQGSVYRGRWKGAEVAIKTFVFSHKVASNKRSPRDQAILEAGVSSSMEHENVVASLHIEIRPMAMSSNLEPAVQIVENETVWKAYLVQELMGCSLCFLVEKKMLDKGGPEVKKVAALSILKDIASGMAYIHDLNVIHGDMKPDNILIKSDKRKLLGMVAKITDFGLCSRINGNKTHVSNFFGGTPFYADPNIRASGQTSKPSDVYSFGILMIELYTGKQPFVRAQDGCFYKNKGFFDLQLLMPREYSALVAQCLHSDPKSRPTFGQIVNTLTQLVEQNIACLQQKNTQD